MQNSRRKNSSYKQRRRILSVAFVGPQTRWKPWVLPSLDDLAEDFKPAACVASLHRQNVAVNTPHGTEQATLQLWDVHGGVLSDGFFKHIAGCVLMLVSSLFTDSLSGYSPRRCMFLPLLRCIYPSLLLRSTLYRVFLFVCFHPKDISIVTYHISVMYTKVLVGLSGLHEVYISDQHFIEFSY